MIRFAIAVLITAAFATPLRAAVDIQDITTPGGIHAWLVEEHSIPFAAIEIRFRGGGYKRGCDNGNTEQGFLQHVLVSSENGKNAGLGSKFLCR